MESELLQQIRPSIASLYEIDPQTVTDSAHFENDLGGDSLLFVQLVQNLETQLRVRLPDEESAKVTTVAELVELIQKHQVSL